MPPDAFKTYLKFFIRIIALRPLWHYGLVLYAKAKKVKAFFRYNSSSRTNALYIEFFQIHFIEIETPPNFMANFTTDDYLEIRRRGVSLSSKIFKKLTNEDIKTCAKHLGIWHNKQLVIDGDEEMDLFTDYSIYAYRPKGFNMAERYLRLFSKDADDFERTLLQSMSAARYAIYQIEQTNGIDTLDAVDVFSKAKYRIVDHQMAKTGYAGLMLAGYLIDFGDFTVQSGGTVMITRDVLNADEVVNVIDQIKDDSVSQFLTNPANGAKLARAVIATTISLGQAKNFSHKAV